jgi:signal transduction histidine kinase
MRSVAGSATLRSRHRRLRHAGVLAAAWSTILTVATLVEFTRQEPAGSVEHGLPTPVLLVALTGILALTASMWAALTQHPPVSVGLSAVATGQLLPVWAGWSWLSDGLRAGVIAAAPLSVAGTAHVALRWHSQAGRSWALRAVWSLAGIGALVHLGGYNPFADRSCRRVCDDITPFAGGALSTLSAVVITSVFTIAAGLLGALAVWRSRPHPPAPAMAGVDVALAMLAYTAVATLISWGDPGSDEVVVLLPSGAIGLLGVAVIVALIRVRRTRLAVDRLVSRLSEPESALRDLGDAIRDIHFAVPGDGRWVDPAGQDVGETPLAGRCVELADETGPVLRLFLTRGDDSVDSLAELTPATRLALRNAQLAAVGKARLADVQASRRRVVATSDAERQRIERDLHDGAQQRLVSAAFHLSLARPRLRSDGDLLAHAEAAVNTALTNLRAISHGIFPSALSTDGLGSALEDLLNVSEVPATLHLHDIADDIPAETAMAAYATVAAALEAAHESRAREARVSVDCRDGLLTVLIESDVPTQAADPPSFAEVTDRVGAVGGQFTASMPDGVARVKVELPCVS